MVNYDLPLEMNKLFNCPVIKAVKEKIEARLSVSIEELKLLCYTFGFFGERGREEVRKIIEKLDDTTKEDVERRIKVLVEKSHLPVSCNKVKSEWGLCAELDCEGSITPIMHCCGKDPNAQLVERVHLSDLDASCLNQYVKTDVYISGVGDQVTIPYKLELKCLTTQEGAGICEKCPFAAGNKITLSDIRNELNEPYISLEFAKISKRQETFLLNKYVKQWIEKSNLCQLLQYDKKPKIEVTVAKETTITPLIVIPAIDEVTIKDAEARESLRKKVYLTGVKKSIERRGLLVGPVLKHPRSGELTILGICFEPTGVDLESFRPNEEQKKLFGLLKEESTEELVRVIGTHVCRIYGRPEAVEANLIAYHTPLSIIWKGEKIPGWVQITNFGDTTTGKRIPRMIKQYTGLGSYVVVETSGRTGLLYFIDQSKEGHILGFGEFVLADRTLVIIDGYDRMHPEERAEFRESYRQGFLKIRRVVSGAAPMRVRVIACENVKKPLSGYLYPCTSLLDNYKGPDIARIDLAIPYRSEDVPAEEIFKIPKTPPKWFSQLQDALRLNIVLAWGRKPEQILFEKDAEGEILSTAEKFDYKYGGSRLPLVSKDMDKKLAKLSAGYAAFRNSYDGDWNLIVKREHVQHVTSLVDRVYSSEGMRLNQYAEVTRKRTTLGEEEFEEIKQSIDAAIEEEKIEGGKPGRPTLPIMDTITRELQIRGTISLNELQAAVTEDISAKVSPDTIRQRMMLFKKYYLIISTKEGYTLTPKGIEFMHRYRPFIEQQQTTRTTPEEASLLACWICQKPISPAEVWTVDSGKPCHITCLSKAKQGQKGH